MDMRKMAAALLALLALEIWPYVGAWAQDLPIWSDVETDEGMYGILLGEGDVLEQTDLKGTCIVMLVRKPSGAQRLRVAEWDGSCYEVRETGDLPENSSLDTYHASENAIILHCEAQGFEMGFTRTRDGGWEIRWLWAESELSFKPDVLIDRELSYYESNNGFVYGKHPWGDLFALDFQTLPRTFEEAVNLMDTSGYAFVNCPNPEDGLHLRAEPDRDVGSLGQFFNRTPVQVLEREGEWTRVRIGLGEASLEGFMLSQNLAFGEEKDAVLCAFPTKVLLESEGEGGATMLSEPREDAPVIAQGMFESSPQDFVIGVAGDDWYVVMREDGSVGYMRQALFYDGNG